MAKYDKAFLEVIDELLDDEGGYVNDPDDPGGETKFGISKRTYPDLDIASLTKSQATAIFFADWWTKYRYKEICYVKLAGELLKASVNIAPTRAHKILQESFNRMPDYLRPFEDKDLVVDGILGPKTFDAINYVIVPELLLAYFRLGMIQYYLDLNKPKYLAGWIRRALT